MPSANSATLPALAAPTVLAVSCSPELVARCVLALKAMGLGLNECGFVGAATAAAAQRPLAIVLVEDIYAFDPEEFDALARDVRASLVRVEEDIALAKLELLLEAAIDDAASHRGELLPARPGGEEQSGRRTEPNPALLAYRVGQRLPSRADLAAAAWPNRIPTPPPPSSG